MNFDDLDLLVDQTLEGDGKSGRNPFQLEMNTKPERKLPNGPGFYYFIDRSHAGFSIHTRVCDNLKEAHTEVLNNFYGEQDDQELYFFETEYLELAEILADFLSEKRFPLDDDILSNISDPSNGWYLYADDHRFELYFNYPMGRKYSEIIKVGPLSDLHLAQLRFKASKQVLGELFPLADFQCDGRSFSLSTAEPNHLNFDRFKRLFIDGNDPSEFYTYLEGKIDRTFYFHFKEMAAMRRFWIALNKILYTN